MLVGVVVFPLGKVADVPRAARVILTIRDIIVISETKFGSMPCEHSVLAVCPYISGKAANVSGFFVSRRSDRANELRLTYWIGFLES